MNFHAKAVHVELSCDRQTDGHTYGGGAHARRFAGGQYNT